MGNFGIKIDLLKLKNSFVTNLKGKAATKRCLVIPIDDSGVYLGEKGVHLNLTAVEMRGTALRRYARPQTKPRKRGVPSHERRGTHGTAHIRGVETYRKPTAANGSNADYQRSRGSRRP